MVENKRTGKITASWEKHRAILCLPETLAAAAPAEAAGVGPRLSRGLGGGLDVCRLPFSHLHSAHTPGLRGEKRNALNGLDVPSRRLGGALTPTHHQASLFLLRLC